MPKNSLIIVTGAAGGMGSALCRLLIEKGLDIIALDHNRDRLISLAASQPQGRLLPICCNLEDPALPGTLGQLLDSLPENPLAGLVNLAGVSRGDSLLRLSDEDWEISFAVNATAPMRLIRVAAPRMQRHSKGSIVNVSSPVGFIGARKPSYAASKAALLGLTMSVARNLGADGIRCNLLLPGTCITHMTGDWSEEKQQSIAQESFLKRLCTTEEVAKTIAFLLSDEASYITGSVVDMTAGGMVGH